MTLSAECETLSSDNNWTLIYTHIGWDSFTLLAFFDPCQTKLLFFIFLNLLFIWLRLPFAGDPPSDMRPSRDLTCSQRVTLVLPVGSAMFKRGQAAVLHITEISRITNDRFLVLNKADWLWLFHCVCLELMAGKLGGAAAVLWVTAFESHYLFGFCVPN